MSSNEVHARLVEGAGELAAACAQATAAGVVAVDTESNSLHAYYARLCVVQLSFAGRHLVVDSLRLGREGLGPLVALLADPGVVKVLHGADYDVRSLDRELGAQVVALRDTQAAAQLAGIRQTGLGALAAAELGVTMDKKHQLADWGARPLSADMLAYAAADTAHLVELARRLEERLEGLGRVAWWLEECAALEAVRADVTPPDALAFERLKGASRLKGAARDRVAALHAWRERVAASLDRPPFKVMQGDVMLRLAEEAPPDVESLVGQRSCGGSLVRRHAAELVALLAAAPPVPPRQTARWLRPDQGRTDRVREVAAVRDRRATELDLDPSVLAPRAGLEAVVDRLPGDADALAGCLGRSWRAAALGAELLPLVAAWRAGGVGVAEPQ